MTDDFEFAVESRRTVDRVTFSPRSDLAFDPPPLVFAGEVVVVAFDAGSAEIRDGNGEVRLRYVRDQDALVPDPATALFPTEP